MENGVLVIFGFTGVSSAHTLKTYANLYKFPFISISPPTNNHYEQTKKKNSNFNEYEADERQEDEALRDTENATEKENNYDASNKNIVDNKNSNNIEGSNNVEVEDYQVNLFPDMIPLLVSLLKYNRWKSVYYFYNNHEGLLKIILMLNKHLCIIFILIYLKLLTVWKVCWTIRHQKQIL
jgi:alpha-glucosidase (family GH31 glycosyl hydrolase)